MGVDGRQFRTSASPKLVVTIIAGIVLFIASVATIAIRATAGARHAATGVFQTIETQGADAAWQQASPDFRRSVSEPRFVAFVAAHRLAGFRSVYWSRVSINNSTAYAAGTAKLATTLLGARVGLVYAGNAWRLGAVAVDDDGSTSALP